MIPATLWYDQSVGVGGPVLISTKFFISTTFGDLSWSRLDGVLDEGMHYLDDNHHLMTEDEEREQFRTYYRILLEYLGLRNPDNGLLCELADAVVDEIEFELFNDTISRSREIA